MKRFTKKILYSVFASSAACALAVSAGLLEKSFTVNAQTGDDVLVTPESYEQYLKLVSPSDAAVNERYVAISDRNAIYLYDSVDKLYRKYEHAVNADQSKNDVTKLQFSSDGTLFFSDKSTSLYTLDPHSAKLAGDKADLVCSTFVIAGDDLYFSNVSGGISSISKASLSDLSLSSSVAIVDDLTSDTVLTVANDEIFYTDSGKYLHKYSSEQSSFISHFSDSLTSIAATNSLFCCTDNSGVFSVYDFIDLYAERENAEPLFTAQGSFSKLSLFGDFVYAIDGDSVKQFSLSQNKFTDYQICASSSAENRLSDASDVLVSNGAIYVADAGNSRISVRYADGSYSVIPTDIDDKSEQRLCATEGTALVWTDEGAYLYDVAEASLLQTFTFGESKLTGAVGVYGDYYFTTSNNGYYRASLKQTSAEKTEWTLSSPVVKSGSHPTALVADVYGDLYVAKSGSLYKYSESEFLDNTATDSEPLFALPVGLEKLQIDYDGNVYALTGRKLTKFVASDSWSTVEFSLEKSCAYSETQADVSSFTFGFEENSTYILYDGNYIVATEDLKLPTAKTLAIEDSRSQIFSDESGEAAVVEVAENAVLVEFDFEAFETAESYFPYLSLTRSRRARTALKLGETSEYNVLAEYDGEAKKYRSYLVKKGYCAALEKNEFSTSYSEEKFGYTTNSVHLYKFPYMHTLMTVTEFEKNAKVKLLGEITRLDHDYYFVEYETKNGKLIGYVPKNFIIDFDGSTPTSDKHALETAPADTDLIWRLAYLICGLAAICILTDYLILRKKPKDDYLPLTTDETAETENENYSTEPDSNSNPPSQN